MKTVIILGDLNVDVFFSGMKRLPALAEEIMATHSTKSAGGSAANVAQMLAMRGCPVRLFAQVGNDDDGRFLLGVLRGRGVRTDTVTLSDKHATGITVSLTYPDDRMLITYPGTISATVLEDLREGYLSPGDHLHLTSYFLQRGLRPSVGELLRKAKDGGMSTSLDPGGDPDDAWDMGSLAPYWQYLDWFMPNRRELLAITGSSSEQEAFTRFPEAARGVVAKLGPRGAMTRDRGAIAQHSGVPAAVMDSTCAGDCFDAGFLHGLVQGWSLAEAVAAGNRCGAESVSCVGLPDRRASSVRESEVGS